ncbi:MAG: HEPN domain-containing protein [Fretibacterium sp.]|nr:HEPN domain-containing protein [Fretibacterium sp.]
MTLQPDERKIMIELSLEKSEENLNAAKYLLNVFPSKAASAAYYSAFHAMQALFLQDGLVIAKKRGHRSGIALFNKDFIHTGIFPQEMGRVLGQLERVRNQGDYSIQENVTPELAAHFIEQAAKFNLAIRNHIQKQQQKA